MDIGALINQHIKRLDPLNKREFKRKSIELCHVGKFLSFIDEGYVIMDVREGPDFIIENSINKVGVEHMILAHAINKKREGSIDNLFKRAENIFSKNYPDKKYLVNIFLKRSFPTLSKAQSDSLIPIINTVINGWIESEFLIENDLIEHIYHMPYSEIDFVPNKGAWGSKTLTNEILHSSIIEKESLVAKYKTHSKIEKQWLLIVIGSLGESSYQMNDSIVNVVNSNFDRIYLLEDFNWLVTRIH